MLLGTKLEEITNARKGIRPMSTAPNLFDSINKTQEGTFAFGDNPFISKAGPMSSDPIVTPEKQPGAWEAIKFSVYKGFVDYAADATDNILSKIQEAKLGLQSSIEQITKRSSDPDKQAVFNQYNEAIAKATTIRERQAARRDLADKTQELATERQYGVAAGEEEFASKTPKLTQARKDVKAYFDPKIADLTAKADVENEGWFTQAVAGAAESSPYTLASKLSIAGFFLNYGVQEQRSIQEKTMLAQAEGRTLSLEDKQNILMNAVGGAVIEAASEHIFPAGAGALSKATIKEIYKFVVAQGIQEGAEEVISYIGQGFLAKITTDKDATLFGIAESSGALMNLEGAGKAFLAGAIMGSVYSSVGGTTGYVKTKIATKKYADTKVEDITPENIAEVEVAIREDAQDQDNVDELFADMSAATVKINEALPVERKAENLESVTASLKEKSANQILQPDEKANTDALIQAAETELKNLYTQQREAIMQPPVEAGEMLEPEQYQEPIGEFTEVDFNRAPRVLNMFVPRSPGQAPGSPLMPGDTSMPMQATKAPTTAPQTDTGTLERARTIANVQSVRSANPVRTKVKPNQYEDVYPTLLSASDLIPSNDAYGTQNANYKPEYQPRGRDRAAAVLQVQDIINKTDLEDIIKTGDVSSGISTFNPADMNILSGNGRMAAIQEIYKRGGEPANKMRQAMLTLARSLGIDTTSTPSDPVISGAIPEGVDPVAFAQASNPQTGLQYSAAENAKNDSKKMTAKMIALYSDTDLNQRANSDFVKDFLSSFSEEELGSFRDSNGSLSQLGKQRISYAILYKAFPSDKLINIIAESTDNNVKNTTNALMTVAGLIVKTRDIISNGNAYNLDISKDITSAFERYVEISKLPKPAGYDSAIDGYFSKMAMDIISMTPMEEKIVKIFYGYRKSRPQLASFFEDYYEGILKLGNPKDVSLFGEDLTPNRNAYIDNAFLKVLPNGGVMYENTNGTEKQPADIPIDEFFATAPKTQSPATESRATRSEPAKQAAPQAVAPTPAQPIPPRPKTVDARATKEPTFTVSMADIERKYSTASRTELQADIDTWLDSDDPQAQEIRNIKDGSQLAEAVLEWKLNLDSVIPTSDRLMKIDLQLLALDAWGRRLENVPKGDAITVHMQKMVDLFRTGQTQNIKNQMNDAVSDDMILHRIIGDQQVINEATARMQEGTDQEKAQNRKDLWSRLSISDTFNPVDVIMGDMYAKELSEAGNYHDSMATADLVARKLTVAGRFLRAAMLSGEIHGTNVARKLIRDFNEQVDPTAAPKIDNKANETEKIINTVKQKALVDAAGALDKGGIDETIGASEKVLDSFNKKMDKHKVIRDSTKQATKDIVDAEQTEEDTLAQKFAKQVVAYSEYEQKPPKEPTIEQRLLKQLMTKFKERNPQERVSYKENPLTVLADILQNRGEYADVWEGAQAILAEATQEEGADFKDDVFTFIDTFLSPTHAVSADKYMKAVIREQLKKSDMTLADFALQFSMNEPVTMSQFFTDLRKAMSRLDDKSFAYLKNYMTEYMTQELAEINATRKAKLRKVQEDRAKKPRHEPEEKLANMIANNIRQLSSNADPKAKTAEEALISNLYKKHSDYYGKTKKPPADLYQLMSDIVSDRAAYESIWFGARSLLQSYPDLAFSDVYRAMQNFNKPIVAESIMRGVVAQTIKDSGTTLTEVAKSYFFVGELAYKNFFVNMKNKMPLLSDADVKYLDAIFRPYFAKAVEQRRQQMRDSLVKQLERSRSPDKDKASFQLALDKLMNAAFRDELSIPELRDVWANRMGLPHLSQDMVKDIYDTMKRIHGMNDTDNIQDEIYQLNKRIAGSTPADRVDQVLAWMRFAMLMNPSTLLTNGMSNMAIIPWYNMADRVQYGFEKMLNVAEKDRVSGRKVIKMDDSTPIGRAVMEHSTPEKIERHLSKSEKWDLKKAMNVERQYFRNPKIDSLVKSVGRAMNFGEIGKIKIAWLGDNKPFTMHFQRSMANSLSAMGYSDSLTDAEKSTMVTAAMERATIVATTRVFRQKLALAKIINNLSKPIYTNKQIREASPGKAKEFKLVNNAVRLAGRITYPFVVTPVALAVETYKLSPFAGIVTMLELAGRKISSAKTKTPIPTETKSRIARQLAQSAVGSTVAFTVGMILSALGYIDLDVPDNPKEENAWQLEGRQRYSIRIPGLGSVSLGWLQPLGTAMFMGASLQQSWDGEVTWEFVGKMFTEPFNTLVKSTIIRDVMNPFSISEQRDESQTVMDYFTNTIFMSLPNLVTKFNKAVDPYQRDIYGGTGWEDFKNRFLTYVPFGTFAIPPKIDIWGNKVPYTPESGALGLLERTFLNFATPFTVRRKTKDPVTDEVIRVYNETGMAEAISAFPAKTFKIKIDGKSVDQDMTGDKYTWYVQESGKNAYADVSALIITKAYKDMTDEQKAEALKKVYDEAREKARKTWEKMGGKLSGVSITE